MKKTVFAVIVLAVVFTVQALRVGPFYSYHRLIDDSPDIVIAQCIATEDALKPKPLMLGNAINSDINVISVLKGHAQVGMSHLAAFNELYRGQVFLLFGNWETNQTISYFSAPEPYRIIPLHRYFHMDDLSGKSFNDQMKLVLASRLYDLNQKISRDSEEKHRIEVEWGISSPTNSDPTDFAPPPTTVPSNRGATF